MKMKLTIVREVEIDNAEDGQTIGEMVDRMISCSIEHDETLSSISFDLTPEECRESYNLAQHKMHRNRKKACSVPEIDV